MVPSTAKLASRKRSHAATLLCASLVAQHLSVPASSFAPQPTTRTSNAATATHSFHRRLLYDQRKATALRLTHNDGGYDNGDDDEEELDEGETNRMIPKTKHDDMIGEMIDSIDWMPSVYDIEEDASLQSASSIRKDSRILPLLPLTEVFIPFSDHTLSIYEERYIELYDWLLDDDKTEGKPEFVVSLAHPSEDGVFASYGVLFKIKDFVEMDESEAQDIYDDEEGQLGGGLLEESSAVKYVATHTATKIVKIRKVLNPASWEKEDTYLRVEAVVTDDLKESKFRQVGDGAEKEDGSTASVSTGNKAPRKWKSDEAEGPFPRKRQQSFYEDVLDLRESFFELVKIQHELKEEVKFTKGSGAAFARGISEGPRGFWLTVLSFQQFLEQRILSHHADIQGDFQENLLDFFGRDKEAPAVVDIEDLPSPLKEEAQQMEARVNEELGPMRLETNLFMQKLIQSDQGSRIKTLITMVKREIRRLQIKKALNGIFTGEVGNDHGDDDAEEGAAPLGRNTSREMAEAEQKQIDDFKRQLERSFDGLAGEKEDFPTSDEDQAYEEFGLTGTGTSRSSSFTGGSLFLGSDDNAFQ
jgi:hypothetical protein